MAVRSHRELIPKSVINHTQADPTILDQMSKNLTRQGITNATLNYLRVSGDIRNSLKQKRKKTNTNTQTQKEIAKITSSNRCA